MFFFVPSLLRGRLIDVYRDKVRGENFAQLFLYVGPTSAALARHGDRVGRGLVLVGLSGTGICLWLTDAHQYTQMALFPDVWWAVSSCLWSAVNASVGILVRLRWRGLICIHIHNTCPLIHTSNWNSPELTAQLPLWRRIFMVITLSPDGYRKTVFHAGVRGSFLALRIQISNIPFLSPIL